MARGFGYINLLGLEEVVRAIHLLREWVEDYPYGSPADETRELLDEIAE